jgi:hypothetical protein
MSKEKKKDIQKMKNSKTTYIWILIQEYKTCGGQLSLAIPYFFICQNDI